MLGILLFTGEAWLHFSGHIYSQNSRTETPPSPNANLLHSSKISVWWEVSWKRMVGLTFFEEKDTAWNYPVFFTQFLVLLEQIERDSWFQWGGPTAHTAKKKQLSYGTPSLAALSVVDFGHQDHQTSLLSVRTSLKLFVVDTGQQTFRKFTKTPVKSANACL